MIVCNQFIRSCKIPFDSIVNETLAREHVVHILMQYVVVVFVLASCSTDGKVDQMNRHQT